MCSEEKQQRALRDIHAAAERNDIACITEVLDCHALCDTVVEAGFKSLADICKQRPCAALGCGEEVLTSTMETMMYALSYTGTKTTTEAGLHALAALMPLDCSASQLASGPDLSDGCVGAVAIRLFASRLAHCSFDVELLYLHMSCLYWACRALRRAGLRCTQQVMMDCIPPVVGALSAYGSLHASLATTSLRLLVFIVERATKEELTEAAACAVAHNALEAVVSAMKAQPDVPRACCRLIIDLCRDKDCAARACAAGALSVMLAALQTAERHVDAADYTCDGFIALVYLIAVPGEEARAGAAEAVRAGALTLVRKTLGAAAFAALKRMEPSGEVGQHLIVSLTLAEAHLQRPVDAQLEAPWSDAEAQLAAQRAAAWANAEDASAGISLSSRNAALQRIHDAFARGDVNDIVDVMACHPRCDSLLFEGTTRIVHLHHRQEDFKWTSDAAALRALAVVLSALRLFPPGGAIQVQLLYAFRGIICASGASVARRALDAGSFELLSSVLTAHQTDFAVSNATVWALDELLLHSSCNDKERALAAGCCTSLIVALRLHGASSAKLMRPTIEALNLMVLDQGHPHFADLFHEASSAGAWHAIVPALHAHSSDVSISAIALEFLTDVLDIGVPRDVDASVPDAMPTPWWRFCARSKAGLQRRMT